MAGGAECLTETGGEAHGGGENGDREADPKGGHDCRGAANSEVADVVAERDSHMNLVSP